MQLIERVAPTSEAGERAERENSTLKNDADIPESFASRLDRPQYNARTQALVWSVSASVSRQQTSSVSAPNSLKQVACTIWFEEVLSALALMQPDDRGTATTGDSSPAALTALERTDGELLPVRLSLPGFGSPKARSQSRVDWTKRRGNQ